MRRDVCVYSWILEYESHADGQIVQYKVVSPIDQVLNWDNITWKGHLVTQGDHLSNLFTCSLYGFNYRLTSDSRDNWQCQGEDGKIS